MKRIIFTLAVLAMAMSAASAQQMQSLPNDPATKVGKLENGLTYYIRHNDKPAQRAEFYLATDAGALNEAPDQDGLAHFLEHMCFNGTKNFPGKGIINYLESIGASFGGNVNASTGIEQTIYLLTNIPLVNPSVVDSCLLIMHDYSGFVLCEDEEIEAERGVIIEEKRTRNTASWRNYMKFKELAFRGTPYATVSIIGSQEQLETFRPQSLRNFYHTWYVPSNQALIVVGDVDVDEVEAKIQATFADVPAGERKVLDPIVVPDNAEPIIGIITDEENTGSEIEVIWKSEATPREYNSTPIGMMNDIIQDMVGIIMNERFSDLASRPDAPFMQAGFSIGNLIKSMDGTVANVTDRAENILPAFEAMMVEVEKMKRYGFTDDEVNRAKNEILSQFETRANKADSRKNAEFVQPMIQNFFKNKSFLDPAMAHQIAQMIMQQLNAAVLSQVAQGIITKDNMVVVYSGPAKDGVPVPAEEQIAAIITKVQNSEIERGAVDEVPAEFLDAARLKGSKVKSSADYLYGSQRLTLANGVDVILMPTEYEKDKVGIQLMKKGGMSLISDEDLYSFENNIWTLYTQNTGVAGFPATMVSKMLSGKQVSAHPYIRAYTHGITASSTRKDIETAFQLLYLNFTQPRFDADEYNQGIKQIQAVLPQLVEQSNYRLQQELYKTIYNSPRRITISQEVLDKASLATLERVYRQLYADAAGATVVITGDFDKTEILPLVQKYIGSLPKGKKATDWKYCGDGFVEGSIVNDFRTKMTAPKVTVVQMLGLAKAYSTEDDLAYEALSYILRMVYTTTLREEEGGTYGASSSGIVSRAPYEYHGMQVAFETNDQQADRLRELAIKGIRDVAENGPSAEDFDKAVKNLEKKIPEQRLRNAYWTSSILDNVCYGGDSVAEYEAAVNALTPAKIQAAAAELVNSGNLAEIVMRPEQ